MKTRTLVSSLLLGTFMLGTGALLLQISLLAAQPDHDVEFVREVRSELEPGKLERAITNLSNWPDWHHFLDSAKALGIRGEEMPATLQTIQSGSVLLLTFLPKQEARKKFELVVGIEDYQPGKMLSIRLLADRKGKLLALFDRLAWKIEILPSPEGSGSLLRATVTAHTANSRARVFTGLVPRILMHQVFYADLQKLGAIKQPHGVILTPESQR